MKGTAALRLSRGRNLEKWKYCICILICPQSGIVFGIATKLLGVCSSSLFIGAPWTTGPKFKSACYHSVWRWGFLYFFLIFFPPSFILSLPIIFFYHSTSALYYFFLFPPHTPVFPCVLSTLITLSLQLLWLIQPLPVFAARRVKAQISLVMPCAMLLRSEGLQQSRNRDPALPSSSQSSVTPSLFPPDPPLCPPFWYLPSSLHPFFPL